ncbi:hypothetical protein OPV22_008812 [Ensete ventricosum]|uniref:Uncharacterized protein n=1 Tax=Ensete ventricosum TaxID=4639 RepID=A0AAV8PXP7_ENSVE|nr:hypothetical protein OPV22_008812 [Ensete ventricosum]
MPHRSRETGNAPFSCGSSSCRVQTKPAPLNIVFKVYSIIRAAPAKQETRPSPSEKKNGRQGQYADLGINLLVAALMQYMSAQSLQHNSEMTQRDQIIYHLNCIKKAGATWLDIENPVQDKEVMFHALCMRDKCLTKEQQQAEDRENARHGERLNKINAQYQEKC